MNAKRAAARETFYDNYSTSHSIGWPLRCRIWLRLLRENNWPEKSATLWPSSVFLNTGSAWNGIRSEANCSSTTLRRGRTLPFHRPPQINAWETPLNPSFCGQSNGQTAFQFASIGETKGTFLPIRFVKESQGAPGIRCA